MLVNARATEVWLHVAWGSVRFIGTILIKENVHIHRDVSTRGCKDATQNREGVRHWTSQQEVEPDVRQAKAGQIVSLMFLSYKIMLPCGSHLLALVLWSQSKCGTLCGRATPESEMVRSLTTMQCCCCEGAYFLTPNHDPNKVSVPHSAVKIKQKSRKGKKSTTQRYRQDTNHSPRLIRLASATSTHPAC